MILPDMIDNEQHFATQMLTRNNGFMSVKQVAYTTAGCMVM
jgi:hypothetical protein